MEIKHGNKFQTSARILSLWIRTHLLWETTDEKEFLPRSVFLHFTGIKSYKRSLRVFVRTSKQ